METSHIISKPKTINQIIQEIKNQVHTKGYIDGYTDCTTFNNDTLIEKLRPYLANILKILNNYLYENYKLKNEIRFSVDNYSKLINISIICNYLDYKKVKHDIYLVKRAFEKFLLTIYLFQEFTINLPVITYSNKKPIDKKYVIQDFPFLAD